MTGPSYFLVLYSALFLFVSTVQAATYQGCLLDETLCQDGESCITDGLFGQCFDQQSTDTPPLLLDSDLTLPQRALLRLELERLANEGFDWQDAMAQCVLAYFKVSVVYDLSYDTEFCNVRSPANVLQLINRIETFLNDEEVAEEDRKQEASRFILSNQELAPLLDQSVTKIVEEPSDSQIVADEGLLVDEETGESVPVLVFDEADLEQALAKESEAGFEADSENRPVVDAIPQAVEVSEAGDDESNGTVQDDSAPVLVLNEEEADALEEALEKAGVSNAEEAKSVIEKALAKLNESVYENVVDDKDDGKEKRSLEDPKLSNDEEKELKQYVDDILETKKSDIKKLTTPQLEKLIGFVVQLQETLATAEIEEPTESNAELEEVVPLNSEHDGQQLLLKKDIEKFVDEDMGLADVEHKIVKGDIQRVEGNRVYIKVGRENITEDELYKLVSFLDEKIATPNNLYFNDFQYDDGQLSFRISRIDDFYKKNDKRVASASGVAQAVYKRRKDIQTLAGVNVDETGIGSGVDVVPVEKSGRDWLFMPILAICAFTITSLVGVLAVHLIRNRRRNYKGSNFPEVVDCLEGKASYEELCRQRMTQDPVTTVGKSASTSSWPDEALLQSCNLDISTGHVILSFLQEYLDTPEKIEEQWKSVADYRNLVAESLIGQTEANKSKNVDQSILPYDENVVLVKDELGNETYVNASRITDSDPRQAAYIATQHPTEQTLVDFWQCIWAEGITLLVNLTDQAEQKKFQKYWPEEGAKTYGIFEVHLVSEHIWSEDYMVRSFYLKNTVTNETRTVTQFHYLAWSEDGNPPSVKSLLEFRRKVNKSYRGRQSAILVHCSTGTKRTGTYCLIDMVINRITKGIKELNIAGSLEFLRDQRQGMVGNAEQYKLVFACVAEEVSALLKNLQQ
ncbi:unnamed protein product [Bursaphelenchus okinawaensis]|uniref:Receptor-type tyrosine-protein phosphatase N2 n=1 Tax=Bursaphelenchus okinawaensis TaxID=465554 RepID=A0A811KQ21_9BILA|nr:unnamed protein product [Bursaphelenchus okinawaensis]CAG9107221.1 unnamed protein product [Bursaphelenchus okinawaensis]